MDKTDEILRSKYPTGRSQFFIRFADGSVSRYFVSKQAAQTFLDKKAANKS